MQTYTVYEPRPAPEDIGERAAGLVFIKEGFSILAFLAAPLWLAAYQLWVELAVYLGVTMAIGLLIALLGGPDEVRSGAAIVINLIFAFEARDIRRRALEAHGYVLKAVVSGRNLDECERRFLQEWLFDARVDHARRASAPGLMPATGALKRLHKEPVIGMFPAHGG